MKRKWQHQMTNPLLPSQCMCFWVMSETRVECCWQPRNDPSNRIQEWWYVLLGVHETVKAKAIPRYTFTLWFIDCHKNTVALHTLWFWIWNMYCIRCSRYKWCMLWFIYDLFSTKTFFLCADKNIYYVLKRFSIVFLKHAHI